MQLPIFWEIYVVANMPDRIRIVLERGGGYYINKWILLVSSYFLEEISNNRSGQHFCYNLSIAIANIKLSK